VLLRDGCTVFPGFCVAFGFKKGNDVLFWGVQGTGMSTLGRGSLGDSAGREQGRNRCSKLKRLSRVKVRRL
jgi:hypothetical protein